MTDDGLAVFASVALMPRPEVGLCLTPLVLLLGESPDFALSNLW